jgi:hypothetical protein
MRKLRFKVGDFAVCVHGGEVPNGTLVEIIDMKRPFTIHDHDYVLNVPGYAANSPFEYWTALDWELAPISDPDTSIPRQIEALKKSDHPIVRDMVKILEGEL